MTSYRARAWGRGLGPWRATIAEAQEDALDAGEANREPEGGPIYISVGERLEAIDEGSGTG